MNMLPSILDNENKPILDNNIANFGRRSLTCVAHDQGSPKVPRHFLDGEGKQLRRLLLWFLNHATENLSNLGSLNPVFFVLVWLRFMRTWRVDIYFTKRDTLAVRRHIIHR